METYNGKTIIIPRSRDWKLIDKTNEYSLKQRLSCKIQEGESPLQIWKKHPKWSLSELETRVKTCTLFPFPAGMAVLEMFKPKRWLDPTAGWGDRLRCAIVYKGLERYLGIDSNSDMQSAYSHIIKDTGADPKKFKVKEGRIQDVRIVGQFDLVFTSPPFYTKEVYNKMVMWETVEDYLKEFLYPMFKKVYTHLESGGHIVLYLEGVPTETLKNIEFKKLSFEGIFYYEGAKMRPYYVWKKS